MGKYILFDMDGVLVNTEPMHFEIWKKIFKEKGIDIDYEHYKGCIGSTRSFLFNLIKEGYGVDVSVYTDLPERFSQVKDEMLKEKGIPRIEGAL